MKNKNKKGFTIVELVIVIAVIGILAGVLIPIFVNLTNKANQAADQALLSNLNKALRLEEADSGKKNETMHDAVEDVKKYGYYLPTLIARTDEDLLWSRSDDAFYLSNDPSIDQLNKVNYWKIQNTYTSSEGYSIYAGENFPSGPVEISTGFDVGYHDDINDITYSNDNLGKKDIVIRTNSFETDVEVTAYETTSGEYQCDSIKHYGDARSVTIINAGDESYHEYGTVGYIEIDDGHLVVENIGTVNTIIATSINAKVDNEGGSIANKYATDASYGEENSKGNIALDVITPQDVDEKKESAESSVNPDPYLAYVKYVEDNAHQGNTYATYTSLDAEPTYFSGKFSEYMMGTTINIIMLQPINLDYFVVIDGTVVIDMNGQTLTIAEEESAGTMPDCSCNLTLKDSKGTGSFVADNLIYGNSGNNFIESGNYYFRGDNPQGGDGIAGFGATLTITGGVFNRGLLAEWIPQGYEQQPGDVQGTVKVVKSNN